MNLQSNTEPTYTEFVAALAKPGEKIIEGLDGWSMHRLHMAVGICGEAGELIDAIKKESIYEKPLNKENVIEELGDLEFYMEGLRQSIGVTREDCIIANRAKLQKRYNGIYSNQAAQERADKK